MANRRKLRLRARGTTVSKANRVANSLAVQTPAENPARYIPRTTATLQPVRELGSTLPEDPAGQEPGERPTKLALRTAQKIVFIDLADAIAIEAQGNSALLRTPSRSYLLRQHISDLARRLERYGFVRIHRSTVVNVACVDEIRFLESGETLLRLRGTEKEYSVSRSQRRVLKSIASVWL